MQPVKINMDTAAAIETVLGELAIRLIPAMHDSADALEACLAIAEIHKQEVGKL